MEKINHDSLRRTEYAHRKFSVKPEKITAIHWPLLPRKSLIFAKYSSPSKDSSRRYPANLIFHGESASVSQSKVFRNGCSGFGSLTDKKIATETSGSRSKIFAE